MVEPSPMGARQDLRIAGDGFVLRPWREEDLDALVLYANDERVPRGLSDRFPHPYTRADGEAFLRGEVVNLTDPVLAIEIDGQACGGIAAHPGGGERRHGAEMGYWLGQRHWGRGLMSRVVAAYVPWVMDALALVRLLAVVLDNNPASARVLLKNDFQPEGVFRAAVRKPDGLHDLRVFSRLRSDAG